MIFIVCNVEPVVQVNDAFLIDVRDTFGQGEITKIEIMPEEGGNFYDVTEDRSLSWLYETSGEKVITIRVNDSITKNAHVTCLTAEEDKLFSSDADLIKLEEELALSNFKSYGKTSYLNKHRAAQEFIIEELNSRGLTNSSGDPISKENIAITRELAFWSRYKTLELIYGDLAKSEESVEFRKYENYKGLAERVSQDKKFVTIDKDGSGSESEPVKESINPFSSSEIVRR